MKIQTVSYEELISGDDYSNKRIGATATVCDGEIPEDVFTNLAYWVKDQFYKIGLKPTELVALEDKLESRQRKLEELDREVEDMRRRWKAAAEFLAKHGVTVPENEIPF